MSKRQQRKRGEPTVEAEAKKAGGRVGTFVFAGVVLVAIAGTILWIVTRRPKHADPAIAPVPPIAPPPEVQVLTTDEPSSLETPLAATVPFDLTGRVTPDDQDAVAFELPRVGGHLIDLAIQGPDGIKLELRRGDKVIATAVTPDRIDHFGVGDGKLVALLIAAGVADAPYTLSVRSRPTAPGIEIEPNDDVKRASPVGVEPPTRNREKAERAFAEELNLHAVSATWSGAKDVDCHAVPLNVPATGAILRTTLSWTGPGAAKIVVIGDEKSDKILELDAAADAKSIYHPGIGARSWESHYLFCVSNEGATPGDPYRLVIQNLGPSSPVEFEPNQDKERASGLPRATWIQAYPLTGDPDWYRVSTERGDYLEATLDPPPEVALKLEVFDEAGIELASATGLPGRRIVLPVERPIFAVVTPVGAGSDQRRYRLRFDVKPKPSKGDKPSEGAAPPAGETIPTGQTPSPAIAPAAPATAPAAPPATPATPPAP